MTPDTLDLIKALATKFGITIEYFWPLLVNYTRWINIMWTVLNVIWIVIGIIAIAKCYPILSRNIYIYNHRTDPNYKDYKINQTYIAINIIAIFVLSFVAIYALGNLPSRIAGTMVPEAQAILDLVAQIKR